MKQLIRNLRILASAVRPEDMADAWKVFQEWQFNTTKYQVNNVAPIKKYFKNDLPIVELDINEVKHLHDHGRRPTGDQLKNPIIVLQLPDSGYLTMDGQHRLLALKESGAKTIRAAVIKLPWEKGVRGKFVVRN